MQKPRAVGLFVALTLPLAVSACGDDDSSSSKESASSPGSCSPPSTVAADPATLPEGLDLPSEAGVVTSASDHVEGHIDTNVTVAIEKFSTALKDAGYTITKTDDEGREGEVFFEGHGGKGEVLLARTTCPPDTANFSVVFEKE